MKQISALIVFIKILIRTKVRSRFSSKAFTSKNKNVISVYYHGQRTKKGILFPDGVANGTLFRSSVTLLSTTFQVINIFSFSSCFHAGFFRFPSCFLFERYLWSI